MALCRHAFRLNLLAGAIDRVVHNDAFTIQHPKDRRSTIVRLTKKGRENFLRMARRHEEWVVSILGELSTAAQSELLQNLTLLQRNLDLHGKG